MAASHYKRPIRIRPTVLLQSSLDTKEIVRETLSVVRECVQALHIPELSPLGLLLLNNRQRFPHRRKSAAERRHITEVRLQLFERSGGRCEMQLSPKCWDWISWETMHACHVISRPRGGTWDLENLKAGCPECHTGWQHNGGKPCPPK